MKYWFIIIAAIVVSACQEETKKTETPSKNQKKEEMELSLHGKWNIIMIQPEGEEIQGAVDSLYDEQMKLLLEDSYFLLQENGRFSEQILSSHRKGEWLLDDNLEQININFPTISETWVIQSIQKDTLKLQANTLEKTKVVFVAVRD